MPPPLLSLCQTESTCSLTTQGLQRGLFIITPAMTLEVEQAVLTKGVASPSPFILLHPPPTTTTTTASAIITAFRRPTGLLFQYLVSKIVLSPRYSSVVIVGLEDHPQRLVPPTSSSSSSSSPKMIFVDGFSDPLGLERGKEGALVLGSPEAMVTSLQARLEKQAPSVLQHPSDMAPAALLVDSLCPLLHAFGLPGCLRWLHLVRKQLPGLSPLVTVLWPQGLPSSTLLSVEDRADTNIYMEACTRHEPSRIPQNHGCCRVVRKSTSGRVQEGKDYYQTLGTAGKMVVHEGSFCPLDINEEEEGEKGDDGESDRFLEDLAAKLRLKQEEEGRDAGEVAIMGGAGTKPEPALIYMEEGDPEFEDEDEDDGLDDDLDL